MLVDRLVPYLTNIGAIFSFLLVGDLPGVDGWVDTVCSHPSQSTQSICITFIQCWTNVEDVGPTLYKCYTNVLCLLGSSVQRPTPAVLKCQCSGVVCEAFKMSSCHDEDQKDHHMSPKTRDVVGLMLTRCRRRRTSIKAINTVLLSRVAVFSRVPLSPVSSYSGAIMRRA